MTEPAAAIGVDIGGTNLRVARVAADGAVLGQRRVPSPVGDVDRFLDTLLAVHDDVTAPHAEGGLPVGIGVASLVRDRRVAVYGPNLRVGEVDLVEALGQRGLEHVVVENDASAAMLGEWSVGAARGRDNALMVTLGTGVGGGAIVDGRLLRGANGFGGEAGHTSLVVGGRPCACGRRGCLEAYASGGAIAVTAREFLEVEGDASTSSLAGLATVDGVAVSTAAEAGDALAISVLEETGRWLGHGLTGMVNLLDPDVVVVGGGAAAASGRWILPAAATVVSGEIEGHRYRTAPPLVPAVLGDDAGIVGAALLAMTTWSATQAARAPQGAVDG